MMRILSASAVLLALLTSCDPKNSFHELATYSRKGDLHVVIESSAGTNKKYEFDKKTNRFKIAAANGREKVFDFLAMPFNWGFIPSTDTRKGAGGGGRPLDAIVLSEGYSTQTLIDVSPVACIRLSHDGSEKRIIVAVPANRKFVTVKAGSYKDLMEKYPASIDIISDWLGNYSGKENAAVIAWEDERYADSLITSLRVRHKFRHDEK